MLSLLACLLALPLLLVTGYLLVLTLLSGEPRMYGPSAGSRNFLIIVPAHNEQEGIGRTVQSLLQLDYPASARKVLVVADNCVDATAERAREAGAEVLVRSSEDERGKGYALSFAFEHALQQAWADAVVVIDADTVVSRNLLSGYESRLQQGALAIQAFYGVLNPHASWRTELITIALAIFHRLRGRGREALGLSSGLRGNGMCFALETVRKVPHDAFSVVEDLEYGLRLGRAGIRIWYADEVEVLGEMVSGAGAESQRDRWEGGRALMRKLHGWPLLKQALQQRDPILLDLAMDVLVPPLGMVAAAAGLLAMVGAAGLWFGGIPLVTAAVVSLPLVFLGLHVARGVALSGLGMHGWAALAKAPTYLLWKLGLKLKRKSAPKEWIRTARENNKKSS